jgi:hypothetical protein
MARDTTQNVTGILGIAEFDTACSPIALSMLADEGAHLPIPHTRLDGGNGLHQALREAQELISTWML